MANIYLCDILSSCLRYSNRWIKKEKSAKHKRASSTLWHIYCCWSGISSHLVTPHYMPLLLQGLLHHQQMHCQWRWNKNPCFVTLGAQIFCPHPSFPTFPCLYLVPTGWYEVGVDVQPRKRWRRWVYLSAISLEWVIRVDQWSRVEVTGWSQNFDRGPHIITRLSRHGRRRWKILGQTNVQNTQLHTHSLLQMDKYSGHLYLNLYLYLCNICVCICICM